MLINVTSTLASFLGNHIKRQIRYVVSAASTADALRETLLVELRHLANADPGEIDTTLLIHPHALNDFLEYNDFLDVAGEALRECRLAGEIQIASFHPRYQFAGTAADDIANYTNRSPYPMLHLLREASVARAVAAFPDASLIFEKNIETMRTLGIEGWKRLFVAD